MVAFVFLAKDSSVRTSLTKTYCRRDAVWRSRSRTPRGLQDEFLDHTEIAGAAVRHESAAPHSV